MLIVQNIVRTAENKGDQSMNAKSGFIILAMAVLLALSGCGLFNNVLETTTTVQGELSNTETLGPQYTNLSTEERIELEEILSLNTLDEINQADFTTQPGRVLVYCQRSVADVNICEGVALVVVPDRLTYCLQYVQADSCGRSRDDYYQGPRTPRPIAHFK